MHWNDQRAMRRWLSLAIAVAAALTVGVTFGVSSALACDTNYWNVSCSTYAAHTGVTKTQFGTDLKQTVYTTWDTYNSVEGLETTADGTWRFADLLGPSGPPGSAYDYMYTYATTDKVGCYNHHTGSMFVNCRHYDGW
jgi:hypothetical protein